VDEALDLRGSPLDVDSVAAPASSRIEWEPVPPDSVQVAVLEGESGNAADADGGFSAEDSETTFGAARTLPIPVTRKRPRVEELLRPGQELVVQVSKEPLGSKGARVTTQLALPGRFLVYMPQGGHVGVSRRIVDKTERERLRGLVESWRQGDEGFIVRTACEGISEGALAADVSWLRQLWGGVAARIGRTSAPAAVHEELDLVLRALRDLMTTKVDRILIDDRRDHERALDFLQRFMPALAERLDLYEDKTPLFESTGVERQIARALGRRVQLPSGGHIVIDHTEALTAIDVNSGRYTGGRDLEETTLQVNLEAVQVVAHQLRLRDIGGLIVVDFIDMEELPNRQKVEEALAAALASDPARCTALPISEFGLVEMTRRRVREDLARNLMDPCGLCGGTGRLKSSETVAYEILRELQRNVGGASGAVQELIVRCEPQVSEQLRIHELPALQALERAFGAPVRVVPEEDFHRERFTVSFQVRTAAGKA
jgi:ribonuclease G